MSEVLKENGMTKYKIQIVQKYNTVKKKYFGLNLPWLNSPDQRQDLNLSIYFYDVFMWHPGWTEGGGAGETKLDLRFHPTPTLCHGRRGVKHEEILAILAEKMQI